MKGAGPNRRDLHGGGAHREAAMAVANRPILVRLACADDLGRTIGEKRTNKDGLEVSWVVRLTRTGEGGMELSTGSMPKRGGEKRGSVGSTWRSRVEEKKGGARRLDCGVTGGGPVACNLQKWGDSWVSRGSTHMGGGRGSGRSGTGVGHGQRSWARFFGPAQKVIVLFSFILKLFK
jgi:hypothetical protein